VNDQIKLFSGSNHNSIMTFITMLPLPHWTWNCCTMLFCHRNRNQVTTKCPVARHITTAHLHYRSNVWDFMFLKEVSNAHQGW